MSCKRCHTRDLRAYEHAPKKGARLYSSLRLLLAKVSSRHCRHSSRARPPAARLGRPLVRTSLAPHAMRQNAPQSTHHHCCHFLRPSHPLTAHSHMRRARPYLLATQLLRAPKNADDECSLLLTCPSFSRQPMLVYETGSTYARCKAHSTKHRTHQQQVVGLMPADTERPTRAFL
jgi:hypothetical protein